MLLYLDNTNVVELRGLIDSQTETAVTNATATVTLLDSAGTITAGPISLTHDAGGNYFGTLSDDVSLTQGQRYTAKVTATVGTTVGTWNAPLVAINRDSD